MDGKISVEEAIMANRINRAIELLAGDQAIYYVGGHSGHVLTHAQGQRCMPGRDDLGRSRVLPARFAIRFSHPPLPSGLLTFLEES